ncbi:hypothetical protein EON81_25785, partial [bacterium]
MRGWPRVRPLLVPLALSAVSVCSAQKFRIDFSRWEGPPLVKTKFGVYQTPFTPLEPLNRSLRLLKELNVRDLRYEFAWGKPDAVAFDQIGGTAARPVYDFRFVDGFTSKLRSLGIRTLFANSYCPNPLKSRTPWDAWKDLPNDLDAWQRMNKAIVARIRAKGLPGARYEVWNEPDMPEATGKMFFSGDAADYRRLYQAGQAGIRAGDRDAMIGGPAAAYDRKYLEAIIDQPLDFASIHGYANFPAQIDGMRESLRDRPDLPILLTEYASFTEFRLNGPSTRAEAAPLFFRDVRGLLGYGDVPKVYWAQWTDDVLGLIDRKGHKKALYNAFQIYGMMPVDRNAVSPEENDGVGVMASSSEGEAGIVAYNPTASDRSVRLEFGNLGFVLQKTELFRIDPHHASHGDDPSTESLVADPIPPSSFWAGTVPAHGVVYLRLSPRDAQKARSGRSLGRHVRDLYRFSDRRAAIDVDFDPVTETARLGSATPGVGAQIGTELE